MLKTYERNHIDEHNNVLDELSTAVESRTAISFGHISVDCKTLW